MPTYKVTIRATLTKTITVVADDEEEACELAEDQFSVLKDSAEEDYDQDTLECELQR